MSICNCICLVSKLPFFTSTEPLSFFPKTYPSLSSKPLFFSIIQPPPHPRFQRPIRATAAMEAEQSGGTTTTGNTLNPPMKLLFVEMGVGYDQHGFVFFALLGSLYYITKLLFFFCLFGLIR